jgi:threonine dehydrogenase-like Zn-dependent dehydrogenase
MEGLERHCPDRLVLGIHDLPGGFGPWVLAPVGAIVPIPDGLSTPTATLLEPFAAALNAVRHVAPREGDCIAVLGPRRLGMLVVAALAAHRKQAGVSFKILALSRHEHLLDLAQDLGADDTELLGGENVWRLQDMADAVIDTTGSADGLELAIRLARREVHLKSTHGQETGGISRLTEMVVDEIALAPLGRFADVDWSEARVAWLATIAPPADLEFGPGSLLGAAAKIVLDHLEGSTETDRLPRADLAVVDRQGQVDAVLRPTPEREVSVVRPGGEVWLHPDARLPEAGLLRELVDRRLKLSTSRCGDIREAVRLMESEPSLQTLGDRMLTHTFSAAELARAFEAARSPDCIKAVVVHSME